MTTRQTIEKLERYLAAGISRDESRWDDGHLLSILNEVRSMAIVDSYRLHKKIAPEWTLTHFPEYSSSQQDDCKCIKFTVPRTINVGDRSGITYIGSSTKNRTFILVNSRVKLSDYTKHPRLWNPANVYVLMDGSNFEMYSRFNIEKPQVDLIPYNPFDVPEFNVELDEYPITGDLETRMFEVAFKMLAPSASQPVDKISDSNDRPQK